MVTCFIQAVAVDPDDQIFAGVDTRLRQPHETAFEKKKQTSREQVATNLRDKQALHPKYNGTAHVKEAIYIKQITCAAKTLVQSSTHDDKEGQGA